MEAAAGNRARPLICLCMIVKDEAPVIRRCLDSVRPLIDTWLIVDTGSSDGTQGIVRDALADLPGALHERPWHDFAHNRSEALELARPYADHSLIIDADDELVVPPGFARPALTADAYTFDIADVGISYTRTQLVNNRLPWRYEGVLHEYLVCEGAGPTGHLPIVMRRNHDGARRRDPSTYTNDAAVLELALVRETDSFKRARYTFYLAQSWRDCGETEKAVASYLARATMGFWDQEVFVSLLYAGRLMEAMGRPPVDVLAVYARATAACPARIEAAHAAGRLCRLNDDFAAGYAATIGSLGRPAPQGGLFVESWIYSYGLADELSVNGYWSGHFGEAADAAFRALESPALPEHERPRVRQNLRFALDRLNEQAGGREGMPAAPSGWSPATPKGGTELMVEGLRARIGDGLDAVDLRINLFDPATRDARPLVVWFHHDIDQAAVQWCRDGALVAGVSRFVFISHWQRERYVAAFGLRPELCHVIRYATEQASDLRSWQPAPVLRCAYTSTPFRGLDVLLDAWDLLPRGTAELHVWSSMKLYTADDGPYRQLLDRTGATPGVVYHGLAPNDELRAALRTMHILAYPNTFAETACLSVMEAMAAGCRVIVPSHGALPETTGGYARIYPWCADAREHAATFATILADEIARPWRGRAEMAVAQQQHCASVYAWSRCLDEWRALVSDLVGDGAAIALTRRPVEVHRDDTPDDRLRRSLGRMRDGGFAPAGILDVGAHDGAFARMARAAFPDAHILMIEALEEKAPILAQVATELGDASHRIALLGDRAGAPTPFYVVDTRSRPDLVTTGSSMFRENALFPMEARSIMQTTLVDVLGSGARSFPFVKLDVQGAELAVLRGLGERLNETEAVLLELSLVAYNDGAPLIGTVTAELGTMGFVLYDLVAENRYVDGRLLQLDAIFVRPSSKLRPQPPFWA